MNRRILLALLIMSILLTSTTLVAAANPGHGASSIEAGTFEAGNFVFPDNATISDTLLLANGIATAPALAFASDTDTGLWYTAANIGFVVGGDAKMYILDGAIRGKTDGLFTIDLNTPSATNPTYTWRSDEDTGLGTPGANQLTFTTGGAEALRINGSGAIGIGTSTPTTTLDVNGSINYSGKIFMPTGTNIVWSENQDTGIGSPLADTVEIIVDGVRTVVATVNLVYTNKDFSVGVDNEIYADISTDRVGILTGTPTTTLDVNGTMSINDRIYHNGDTDTYTEFTDDAMHLRAGGMLFLSALESATDELVINDLGFANQPINVRIEAVPIHDAFFFEGSTGRVGIGTASPTQSLDVNGNINISSGTGKLYTPEICLNGDCQTAWPAGFTSFTLGGDAGSQQTISDSDVLNITGGTSITTTAQATDTVDIDVTDDSIDGTELADTITLDANLAITQSTNDVNFDSNTLVVDGGADRVGIGTATPTATLDVTGTIVSEEIDIGVKTPVEIGTIKDDTSGGTATTLDYPNAIHVSGKYAYVPDSWDAGLSILDVSDPTNPIEVGHINDTAKGGTATTLNYATDVYVSGTYAYVASYTSDGLSIIDVSDPTDPIEVGYINDTEQGGTATTLDNAKAVYVSGKYAYVTSYTDDGLSIIDVSDPTAPVEVGYINDTEQGGTATTLDGAYNVYVSGKYAYVTGLEDSGLSIIDVSDPTNPIEVGNITDDSVGGTATAIDHANDIFVQGHYAYITSGWDDGMSIINVSDPTNPTEVGYIKDTESGGSATTLDGAKAVYVSGKYAYVTSSWDDGVSIIDVSDPTSPTEAGFVRDTESPQGGGTATTLDYPGGIYIAGRYAYVTSQDDDGVSIIDLGGFDSPTASIGALETGNLEVVENTQIGNDLHVGSSLTVGQGGANIQGKLSVQNDTALLTDLDVGGAANVTGILSAGSTPVALTNAAGYILEGAIEQNTLDDSEIATGGVGTDSIADDSILEADLDLNDAPIDGDILTYFSDTGGDFLWRTCAEITGDAGLCDGVDDTGSSSTGGGWTNTSTLISSNVGDNITMDSGVLFVDATNNRVGLGTSAPTTKLDVNGSINISNATGKLYTPEICLAGDCQTVWPAGFTSFTLGGELGSQQTISDSDVLNITGGTSITTTAQATDTIDIDVTDDSIDGTELADTITLDATLAITQGSNDVIFDSDTLVIDGGADRVGIGTINPEHKLHLLKASGAPGNITLSIENNDGADASKALLSILTQTAAGDPYIYIGPEGGTLYHIGVDNSDSDKFMIGTGGAVGSNNAMTITSTGNIGINTTSPLAKLHVSVDNKTAMLVTDSGDSDALRLAIGDSETFGGYLTAYNTSGDLNMIITGEAPFGAQAYFYVGNVGFGTRSPAERVDVNGSVQLTGSLIIGTTDLTEADLDALDDGSINGSEIADNTVAEVDLNIQNAPQDGYVLSYTTDAGANVLKWEVDQTGSLNSAGGWTNTSTLISSNVGDNITMDSGVLFVDATNNRVGIADTTPSYPLDVTGDAQITGTLNAADIDASSQLAVGTDAAITANRALNVEEYTVSVNSPTYGGYLSLENPNTSSGADAYGVYGYAAAYGASTDSYGGYFTTYSPNLNNNVYGIYAESSDGTTNYGGYFETTASGSSDNTYGTYTYATGSNKAASAVFGDYVRVYSSSATPTQYGVYINSTRGSGTAYGLYSVAGTNYFADNVGIGTTTPGEKLAVNGTINASGSINPSAGIDVAEKFKTAESLLPGMLVSAIDGDTVETATTQNVGKLVGVVSTSPGMTLGAPHLLGMPTTAVAITGRVPVRVTGIVEAGDYITISDTPGIGTAATEPGFVVGRALENSNDGLVTILVEPGYFSPQVDETGSLVGNSDKHFAEISRGATSATSSEAIALQEQIDALRKELQTTTTRDVAIGPGVGAISTKQQDGNYIITLG